MKAPRLPNSGPRRAVLVAIIAAGIAIGAAATDRPGIALATATIAIAAALSVLRHLVNLEDSR